MLDGLKSVSFGRENGIATDGDGIVGAQMFVSGENQSGM